MRRLATGSWPRLLWALAALVTTPVAEAGPYVTQSGLTRPAPTSITPMLGISGRYGLEVGAKVDFLVANPGFIPHLNNSVFVEGAVFAATDGGPFIAPELRWEFHLHPQWTVYGEAGIEANLGAGDDDPSATLLPAAGGVWRIPGKSFTLRGEVDLAHGAVRAGPSFGF